MEESTFSPDFPDDLKDCCIIFRYSKANIYSYNALIGALEIHSSLSEIPIFNPTPPDFFGEIDRLHTIEKFTKQIIGLSLHTFQLEENVGVINELNNHPNRDNMYIITGGPHPSARPEDLLNAGADVVVVGEGEKTFPELVDTIISDNSISQLKGIAYRQNDEIVFQPPNEPINLDDYPPFASEHQLYSALEITRGCRYKCKYCQTPQLFGRNVRYRSPKEIIKWGKFLLSKRKNWDFRFITPNAFGYGSQKSTEPNLSMIKELLSGLKELDARGRKRIFFGTFPSEVRPESITEETLEVTREYCDNDNLTIGAQSGSERILTMIQRGHSVEKIIEAVELARDFNFKTNVDFIIGYPEETEKDQYQTLDLCKQLISMDSRIHMHYFIPLPGTAYENQQPSPIVPEILKILRKWSNDGIIFGSWQHQYDLLTNEK